MATTPKLTKEQVRTPDAFQQNLTGSLDWVSKNSKLVVGVLVAAVLVGGGVAVVRYRQAHVQMELQEKFSLIERTVMEKKQAFEDAKRGPAPGVKAPEAPKAIATGDIEKDYGHSVADLEMLVHEAPWSTAAQMAALLVADLRGEYGQNDAALKILNDANPQNDFWNLPTALLVSAKANIMANQGDCKGAVGLWEKLARASNASYLHDEAKLRMALCYESMNDTAKAEQLYGELAKKDEKGDHETAKDAERYLRLLKVKKATKGG